MQIKDYRKLFSDTLVTTTHFLKECIKIPKIEDGEIFSVYNTNAKYTPQEIARMEKDQQVRAFQRGAMNFEDYNYDQYNQYILVDPNKEIESSTKSQAGGLDDQIFHTEKLLGFAPTENMRKRGGTEQEKKHQLSEKQLELSVKDEYSHHTLDVKTDAEN